MQEENDRLIKLKEKINNAAKGIIDPEDDDSDCQNQEAHPYIALI